MYGVNKNNCNLKSSGRDTVWVRPPPALLIDSLDNLERFLVENPQPDLFSKINLHWTTVVADLVDCELAAAARGRMLMGAANFFQQLHELS